MNQIIGKQDFPSSVNQIFLMRRGQSDRVADMVILASSDDLSLIQNLSIWKILITEIESLAYLKLDLLNITLTCLG